MASKPLGSLTFAEIFGRMGDLPDLVTVSASTTVETALKTMASTRVSAVCVTSHVDPRKIVAVVGFHDAVSYVASRYGKEDPEQLLGATLDSLLTLNTSEESYRVYERDVNDLIGDTLKAFTAKLHRALITDVTGKYGPHIITQTDMIRYITYHPECAPFDVSKTTLEAAGLVGKKVVTMPESATALDGFKLLSEANMLAVPVVDKEGKVVGTLATSDLRGMTVDTLSTLSSPVLDFIKSRRFVHLAASNARPEFTALSTVKEVLDTMTASHVHRVWVNDANGKVVGVVSMSDILRVVQ